MSFQAERFRDQILAHLIDVGSDSISGVARALSQGRPQPIHRLTVAGYLSAMAEDNVLREIQRPPSKHYQVANPHAHKDLYRRIGDAVREVPLSVEDRSRAALAALVRVLGRPVFRAELQHARIPVPEDLPRVAVDDDKRRAYRAMVPNRFPNIELPRADALYDAPEAPLVEEVIRRALLAATEAQPFAADLGTRATQAALPLGGE